MNAVRPLPLHALAEALVLQPTASMEQLAQAIGVSRATLHRMVASRDDLLYQVHRLACQSCMHTFAEVDLEQGPVMEVLSRLIRSIRPHATLFLLLRQQGASCRDPRIHEEMRHDWDVQRERLTRYFERGQQAGMFRQDLPAAWLVDAVAALIDSATEAVHEDRLSPADFERVITTLLLEGLHAPATAPA